MSTTQQYIPNVSFRHCYEHIGDRQKPGGGRETPGFFRQTPMTSLYSRNHKCFAHHQAFDKPVMHHWYMSTPQQPAHNSSPKPFDHQSSTLIREGNLVGDRLKSRNMSCDNCDNRDKLLTS